MKKLIVLVALMVLVLGGVAISATKVGTFGAPNSSGTAPLEVNSDRAITVASDASLSISGTTTAAAVTASSVVVDGSIYTATLSVDGAIYGATSSVDPCATLGSNAWLFFNPAGALCICKSGVAENTTDGTTNCY